MGVCTLIHNTVYAQHLSPPQQLSEKDVRAENTPDHDFHSWFGDWSCEIRLVKRLSHPVESLRNLIEEDKDLLWLFKEAFSQIPKSDVPDQWRQAITDYQSMLIAIDDVITTAPLWDEQYHHRGVIGAPMNEILIWLMNTRAGAEIFRRSDVNWHLKRILKSWTRFLETENSVYVLNHGQQGWLSKSAIAEILRIFNEAQGAPVVNSIDQAYICRPQHNTLGFSSWDGFFTKHFQPAARPVASPYDDDVIVNACESAPLCLVKGIAEKSRFDLKGQSYSLVDMLANDPDASKFENGSCYQAFLSALSYHRWHTPISGKIVKIINIPGTYFATQADQGFDNVDPHTGKSDPDPEAPDRSQKFLTSVAARMAFFIQADNPKIGLMVFLAVGMAEVSSNVPTVVAGQHVRKGDELGAFHYGGSTHCLLFQKDVNLEWTIDPKLFSRSDSTNIAVRSQVARVLD